MRPGGDETVPESLIAANENPMEGNKGVVSEYVRRFNDGDLEGLEQVFSEEAMVHGVLGWGKVWDRPATKADVDGR